MHNDCDINAAINILAMGRRDLAGEVAVSREM